MASSTSVHPIRVAATYQASIRGARTYTAEGCEVSEAYDRVRCVTAPGLGEHHAWRLFVDGDVFGSAAVT